MDWLFFLLSISIVIPIVFICYRVLFNKFNGNYIPFIALLLVAFFTELTSYYFGRRKINFGFSNIYLILEGLLLVWQFYVWRIIKSNYKFISILVLLLFIWIISTPNINGLLHERNSFYRLVHSFVLVILGIEALNSLVINSENLLRDARFYISAGIVLFFTYNVIVESFVLNSDVFSRNFINNVFTIKSIINAFVNIIFAIAILCIPAKNKYTLQF